MGRANHNGFKEEDTHMIDWPECDRVTPIILDFVILDFFNCYTDMANSLNIIGCLCKVDLHWPCILINLLIIMLTVEDAYLLQFNT